MKYLNKNKTFKYYVKSSLITFGSVFFPVFTALVMTIDVANLQPEQITGTFILSLLVTVLRLAFIASLIALQKLLLRFKK